MCEYSDKCEYPQETSYGVEWIKCYNSECEDKKDREDGETE